MKRKKILKRVNMQRFKEKHILMDTNLLIAISKYSAFGFFDDFLKEDPENKHT